jgi:PGAP1-like protein
MKIIVIGIHGIGNKPSAKILKDWWRKSILEGLKKNNYPLHSFDFELVYWADMLHEKPLDPNISNRDDPLFMVEKYLPESQPIIKPVGFRQKALEYLEKYYDRLIIKGLLSLENKTITELFIHRHMKDLESYYATQYVKVNGDKLLVKNAIIKRFLDTLKKHSRKKIFLIAHSMGSIIVHDALLENPSDIKIDTLVSIGSPLAQRYVIDKYKNELKEKSVNKFIVPDNVTRYWYNMADLEDQVAINHTLAKYYLKNLNGLEIIDKIVKNNFTYDGITNPHKSFGYLRTPEFAEIINSFLASEKKGLFDWLKSVFKN